MIDERFIIIGAILAFMGCVVYLRGTLKGKTRPNRVSWFLWTVVPFIALIAQLNHGVGWPALLTFAAGFGPLLVL